MQSYWKRCRCLLALVLAGGAGVLSRPQAAMGAPAPPPMVLSSEVTALDFLDGSLVQIYEHGDGTALTGVGTMITPTVFLGVVIFDSTTYEIFTDFEPGQSGQTSGVGEGHFTMEGVFGLDLLTFMPVGPFDVSVDIAVTGATTLETYVSQGITAQFDPVTGQTSIVRQHVIGNQGSGDTAASMAIYVDDGSGYSLVKEASGVWGVASLNRVLNIEQIH